MNAIRNVFAAFGNLAAAINALAGVIEVAAGKLRQQLALDEMHVIEHQPQSEPEAAPSPKRNGRSKAAAV